MVALKRVCILPCGQLADDFVDILSKFSTLVRLSRLPARRWAPKGGGLRCVIPFDPVLSLNLP